MIPSHSPNQGRNPRIAVVVVNYRTAEQTIACVQSLHGLHYSPFEIIVVDNDSRDGSAERFERELSSTRTLRAAGNGGYTAGNNLGIAEALLSGAEYVMVVNPDTVVANPDFLAPLVRYAETNPNVGAIGPRVFLRSPDQVQNTVLRFPWLHRRIIDAAVHRLAGRPLRSGAVPRQVEVLNGVCVLFRADALRDVGLFDARTFAYIEDVDWAWRACRRGWSCVYLPVDSIVHEQKVSGYERGGNVEFLLKRNTLYFLLKTRRYLQAAGYSTATLLLAVTRSLRGKRDDLGWLQRIVTAHAKLWTGRWDAAMGPPT